MEAANGKYNAACGLYSAGARLARIQGSPSLIPILLAWSAAHVEKGDLASARESLSAASDANAVMGEAGGADEPPASREQI